MPKSEEYILISQIKRAAISIPLNISEGNGRRTMKDRISFLYIAQGSINEIKTIIFLCLELEYIEKDEADLIMYEIENTHRLLQGYLSSLKAKL